MNHLKLAHLLVESVAERRILLLEENGVVSGVEIAESLQQLCYEAWTSEPTKVFAIVETLEQIADYFRDPEINGYADWSGAIKDLVEGDLNGCLRLLDKSEAIFKYLGKSHLAAKTQTSKLYALALRGRYDEAVACGKRALDVFLRHGDNYSAGKIEHNIGNLFARRDLYRESEPYLESAHRRFSEIDDQRQLASVENCQAFVKSLQNEFRAAVVIVKRNDIGIFKLIFFHR